MWFIPVFECAEQGIPGVLLDAILEKVYGFYRIGIIYP